MNNRIRSLMAGGFILAVLCSMFLPNINYSVDAAPAVEGTQVLLGGDLIRHASAGSADFDGDGDLEIVVGTRDGMLHVIAHDGANWSPVWSRQTAEDINAASPPNPQSTNQIESASVIADLDNDGRLEIVVTTGGLPRDEYNGGLLVYEYQSGGGWSFVIDGDWPQPKLDIVGGGAGAGSPDGYWDGIYGSPAAGDLDGDGDLEIVFQGEDRRIHVYHHDGTVVEGWPLSRDNGDPILRGGISSPALGDLDGDGLPEIVVGSINPEWAGEGTTPDYTKAAVWALNGDSTLVEGWPQYANDWVDSSPALGDIDDDGELEVIVGTGRDGISQGDTGGHYVYAWNTDGTSVAGWPRPTGANMASSPALADLDEDGVLDVIIGCGAEEASDCHNLYAWHGDGSNVPGFPMQPVDVNPWAHKPRRMPFPPVVADIDGDNHLEILLTMAGSNGVSVVNHDGMMSTDYSRVQDEYFGMLAPPLVADVDNDGLLETVGAGAGSEGEAAIYIWDEVASASAARPWPMFHRDSRRSGLYPLDQIPPTNPTSIEATPDAGAWTNENTIEITWSGAADEGSGVARYYYVWDSNSDTLPTTSDPFVAEPTQTLTGDPLADGDAWYFHLRTADQIGNLAEDALHLGPFKIDTQAPSSQASSPEEALCDIPVSWQGTDEGSGIETYSIQVREGATGAWQDWLTDVPSTTLSATYTAACGITYDFRSIAIDAADNQEIAPDEADTSTTSITEHVLRGLVTNNQSEPIWSAQAQSVEACAATQSDAEGNFALYYPQAGAYDVTAAHENFGALPPINNLSTTVQMTTTFVLPPKDDVIQNGDFESGDLTGWVEHGAVQIAAKPHSGEYGLAVDGAGALSQTVTLPEDGTLSWLYSVASGSSSSFQVQAISISVEPTQGGDAISITLASDASSWTHQWLAVGALGGEQAVLKVSVDATDTGGAVYFDDVTLGTTVPGNNIIYLPLVLRK